MLALLEIIHVCKLKEERLNHMNQLNVKTQKNRCRGSQCPISPGDTPHAPTHLTISPPDPDSRFP